MVSAILVAAGNSTRTGGVKKQFLKIRGVPVVVRSVAKLQHTPEVGEILVVTKREDIELVKQLLADAGLDKVRQVVAGGETRQQSVLNGLVHCDPNAELVAIHDAARPFVAVADIQKVIDDARRYRAATLGVPVKDTVKVVQCGVITSTPERSSLYLTQTPQVFEASLYREAAFSAQREGLDLTDDCQLVERMGVPVHMTEGSYENIKITTPDDIRLSRVLAEEEEG